MGMNIEKLIGEVFIRPPLWDQRNKNHHNRFVLNKKWDEVAEKMNTSRVTVRNKWKALRDKFRSTLASIPEPDSGDPDALLRTNIDGLWKHFHSLVFLKDQFGKNSKSHDDDDKNNILSSSGNYFGDEEIMESQKSESWAESSHPNMALSPPLVEISTPSSSRSPSIAENGSNVTHKKKRNIETEEDDDLVFFRSLLPHVRKFSAYQKMSYRMQILQVTQSFMEPANHHDIEERKF